MKLIFRLAVFFALATALVAQVVPYQRQMYTTNAAGVRLGQGTFTNLSVLETGGTALNFLGAVGDGEFLQRNGTNIVGTAGGIGDMTKAVYDVGDDGAVDEAAHATNADFATEASHATNADLATSATYAGLATNATYAGNATNLVAGATGADLTLSGVLDMGDNALTNVSAFYGDAVTASNTVSTGELTVETNATVKGDAFIGNDLTVTNDATVTGDLSVGGTLTVDEVDTGTLVITNSLTVSNMYVNTMVVTNNITSSNLYAQSTVIGTNAVGGAAVTGTNSGTFGTLLSVTNAAVTWGVEAVTQSGGTNYTLPFAGTASYPNTYLAYTMTGNLCFEFTTNRLAGRCRTVILYGNGAKGRLDFNSDNHLVGTLANGIVVTNTYILSFLTTGTYETNVFISGQYAE